MAIEELLGKFLELLVTGTYLAQVAGLVLVVTQFLKFFYGKITTTPIDGNAARYLTLAVQVLFWGIYVFLKSRGMETQFFDWAKALEGILGNLGSILLPAIVTSVGVDRAYNALHARNVPGFHKSAK
jgi:hypothetical protein